MAGRVRLDHGYAFKVFGINSLERHRDPLDDRVVARKNIRCLNFVALERSRKTSIGMRGTMRCWSIAGADGNALDGKYRTAKHFEVPEHLETEPTTDLVSSSKIDVRNLEKRRLCGGGPMING